MMSVSIFLVFIVPATTVGGSLLHSHERCSSFFRSQYKQDEQLVEIMQRGVEIEPFYVDLAANHYEHISNTFALDRCLGWRGLCIEPNAGEYYFGLLKHRTCQLFPICISNVEETVTFLEVGPYGGILGTNKHVNNTAEWAASINSTSPQSQMTCVTLSFLLMRQRVRRVGFLSLDVEGHELQILQGIDWDKVEIDIIALESNSRVAVDYLLGKGYKWYTGELFTSDSISRQLL